MNWKGWERKQSWPSLSYMLEGLWKNDPKQGGMLRVVVILTQIRSYSLQNKLEASLPEPTS
jgi:hypothetical protein